MRASRCAAVGVVTKLVDVHATFGAGVVASNVPRDSGWGTLGGLLESHCASDLGISAEDSDYGNKMSAYNSYCNKLCRDLLSMLLSHGAC